MSYRRSECGSPVGAKECSPRRWEYLASLAILAFSVSALAAEKQNVFIEWGGRFGDKIDPIWVVTVDSGERGVEQTNVRLREEFGENRFKQLPPFGARAVGVTSDSTELVLLLANRRWLWLSAYRNSYGPLLPDEPRGPGISEQTRIITLAGERHGLWALGEPDQNSKPSPPPAAATTQATTRPTTRPAEPTVYSLGGEKWTPYPARWPAGTTPSQWAQISMAVVGDWPCIVVPTSERELAVYRLAGRGRQWERLGSIRSEKPPMRFKMLDLSGNPAVWLFDGRGMGRIWTEAREMSLAFDVPRPAAEDVDLTVAGSVIRCVYQRDRKLYEQRYSLSGAADGAPAELSVERSSDTAFNWPATLAMAAVAVLILSMLLRRRDDGQEQEGDQEQ